MKHTPGKWRNEGKLSCDNGTEMFVAFTSHFGIIADKQEIEISRETEIANAQLIAAAPELLEACKQLLEDMRYTEGRGDKVHTTAIGGHAHNMLKNAIKKAEGE